MAPSRVLRRAHRRPPPRRRAVAQRRAVGFTDAETSTDLDLISPYMADVDAKATTVEMTPLSALPAAGPPRRSTRRHRLPPGTATGAWPAWLALSVALAAGVMLLFLLPSTPH